MEQMFLLVFQELLNYGGINNFILTIKSPDTIVGAFLLKKILRLIIIPHKTPDYPLPNQAIELFL